MTSNQWNIWICESNRFSWFMNNKRPDLNRSFRSEKDWKFSARVFQLKMIITWNITKWVGIFYGISDPSQIEHFFWTRLIDSNSNVVTKKKIQQSWAQISSCFQQIFHCLSFYFIILQSLFSISIILKRLFAQERKSDQTKKTVIVRFVDKIIFKRKKKGNKIFFSHQIILFCTFSREKKLKENLQENFFW